MSTVRERKPRKNTTKARDEQRRDAAAKQLESLPLAGEIVTFRPQPNREYTHQEVIDALKASGLDEAVAKAFRPKKAFSRAAKKLEDDKVLDPIRTDGITITYQLTKKQITDDGDEGEMEYRRETKIYLDTTTGQVKCKKPEIQTKIQNLLNKALDTRTAADLTDMIQDLFEKAGDAFPDIFRIRDQGGAYFVPIHRKAFVDQITDFLRYRLGGKVGRWPIPKGTAEGDEAISDAITTGMKQRIDELNEVVTKFDINTHAKTMETMATNWIEARTKAEAYALYMTDKGKEILKAIDKAEKEMVAKVGVVKEEKANLPPEKKVAKYAIMGHASTGILHWLGANGFDFEAAKRVLAYYNITDIKESNAQYRWNNGRRAGIAKPAKLSKEEERELRAVASGKKKAG